MANRKLTELPTLSPINFDSTDLLYIVDVQTDISKKIPYSLLAGDSLIALSAYASQNTLNINYLSGSIETNTAAIATLEGGEIGLASDIDFLSSTIDGNFNFLSGEIDTKADQTAVNLLATDISIVSGDLNQINIDIGDSFVSAGSLSQGTLSLTASNDTVTSIDLGVETTDSPIFAGLTVNGVNVPNQINTNTATIANIRTLSGFTGTVSTTTTLTATHFVPITINGTSYNLLLNQ